MTSPLPANEGRCQTIVFIGWSGRDDGLHRRAWRPRSSANVPKGQCCCASRVESRAGAAVWGRMTGTGPCPRVVSDPRLGCGHCRIRSIALRATERRTGTVLSGPGLGEWVADPAAWPGLCSLIRAQTERKGPMGSDSAPCATASPAGRRLRRPCWTWSAATGGGERPAPHPGRAVPAVPGGRRPHAHGACPRRDGHPAPGRPEHTAHATTEFQYACIHRAAARPHRSPTLDAGRRPALNSTLRLPWGMG